MVHDLQQQVEHVRVGLLDLVEQQHAVRLLGDRFGEQPALVEAHVARRRADQARDRVALHVFGHVEAQELHAERDGELARDLGLADAGRAGEQEAADRVAFVAEAGARHLDRGAQRIDRGILAEDDELEVALQVCEHLAVRGRHVLRRDARDARDHGLDVSDGHRRFALGGRLEPSEAPASSTTSIALSGRWRSLM